MINFDGSENRPLTTGNRNDGYYQALQLRGIDSALVRIPGASHGITARPSNLIAKVAHILKWFEKHRVSAN